MTGKLCFWAILSTSDLKFIYFSPSLAKLLGIPPNVVPEAFQGRALWEFIHPEEYAMARDDLKKFMQTKNIGGSVTRCRLIDLDDIIEHKVVRRSSSEIDIPIKIQPRPLDRRRSFDGGPNWEVVDVVMYLVTDQIILTFFHADYEIGLPSGAGSLPLICQEVDFTLKDGNEMMSLLHSISPANAVETRAGSVRIFQIMETETKKVLVTWPPATDKSRDAIQLSDVCLSQMLVDLIEKKAQRSIDPKQLHPYEYATCVHQAQVYSQLVHESGQTKKVESIVVQYGSVTFGSFDVSCLDQTVPTQMLSLETVSTTIPLADSASITPSSVLASSPSPVTHGLQQRSSFAAGELDTRILERDNDSAMFTPMSADSRTAPSTSVWNANIQLNLGNSPTSSARVVCESCHTDSSPEWRKGPTGQKTLCNACGLRYARSVAKQDSFGRRQRGVRVVINNDPEYKYPKSPSSMQIKHGSSNRTQYTDDVPAKFHESQSEYSVLNDQHHSTAPETAASLNKRRKKSRYLPIGDNRAGARTRAARKARMMQPDNEQEVDS